MNSDSFAGEEEDQVDTANSSHKGEPLDGGPQAAGSAASSRRTSCTRAANGGGRSKYPSSGATLRSSNGATPSTAAAGAGRGAPRPAARAVPEEGAAGAAAVAAQTDAVAPNYICRGGSPVFLFCLSFVKRMGMSLLCHLATTSAILL